MIVIIILGIGLLIPIGYSLYFPFFANGKKKVKEFNEQIIPNLKLLTESQTSTFEYRIDSDNPFKERQNAMGEKYKTIVSVTQSAIILHCNFTMHFLGTPEYKKPIVLYYQKELVNPLLLRFNTFKIKSINLNSFEDCTHIEASYFESNNTFVTIRIKGLNEHIKDAINKILNQGEEANRTVKNTLI